MINTIQYMYIDKGNNNTQWLVTYSDSGGSKAELVISLTSDQY